MTIASEKLIRAKCPIQKINEESRIDFFAENLSKKLFSINPLKINSSNIGTTMISDITCVLRSAVRNFFF